MIVHTKVARLSLIVRVDIRSTYTTVGEETFKRQVWIKDPPPAKFEADKNVVTTQGYLIGDPANAMTEVGVVTMTSNPWIRCPESVEAIILSQAQYLGNERRIEDLGYYLWNIMIIQRIREGAAEAERVGLGRILETAWNRANPRDEVIHLQ